MSAVSVKRDQHRCIVVVGSSGAGKTTLVNGLRNQKFLDRFTIPKRYVTRPPRAGDDLIENQYVSQEEFDQLVQVGKIWPYWQRELDHGRIEQYGFVNTSDSKIHIYSANNAFLRDNNKSLDEVLSDAIVFVIESSEHQRGQRLSERSPDMKESERIHRLSDSGLDVREGNIIIDTTELTPTEGQEYFQQLIETILDE